MQRLECLHEESALQLGGVHLIRIRVEVGVGVRARARARAKARARARARARLRVRARARARLRVRARARARARVSVQACCVPAVRCAEVEQGVGGKGEECTGGEEGEGGAER